MKWRKWITTGSLCNWKVDSKLLCIFPPPDSELFGSQLGFLIYQKFVTVWFSFVSCVIACYGKQRTFSVCKVENALWSEVITIMCGNVGCILNIKPCFCVSHNCHFLNRDYLKLLTPSTSQEERYWASYFCFCSLLNQVQCKGETQRGF